MNEPIISVSGLRGIVGTSLDPILAIRFVSAFLSQLPPGKIVVARDGRSTGPMLADAICSAINALGRDVLYANVAATPTVGVLVRERDSVGGIQISASHNPPEYNGIKLFGKDGRVIDAVEGEKVIAVYKSISDGETPSWTGFSAVGQREVLTDSISEHLEKVLATVDVEKIREQKFNVILDSNRGSGSILGKELLETLGCQVNVLGGIPDGHFEHTPEPTAINLEGVAQKASEINADVCFCQDPDADRLALIDETGNYVGEEYTLAITMQHALRRLGDDAKGKNVVINCASSRMSIDIAEAFGAICHQSAVGEANVTNKMIELDAVYGGEGNGGPIDPRVGYVRDSFVAMAQTLDAMASSGKKLSELAGAIPSYGMNKEKVSLDRDAIAPALDAIENEWSEAKANRLDGLRLDWEDRWLLVRASNTEPIVRTISEAPTLEDAKSLCQKAAEIISGCTKK